MPLYISFRTKETGKFFSLPSILNWFGSCYCAVSFFFFFCSEYNRTNFMDADTCFCFAFCFMDSKILHFTKIKPNNTVDLNLKFNKSIRLWKHLQNSNYLTWPLINWLTKNMHQLFSVFRATTSSIIQKQKIVITSLDWAILNFKQKSKSKSNFDILTMYKSIVNDWNWQPKNRKWKEWPSGSFTCSHAHMHWFQKLSRM